MYDTKRWEQKLPIDFYRIDIGYEHLNRSI